MSAGQAKIRIIIVDNDAIVCHGLKMMLTTSTMEVVETCQSLEDGLTSIRNCLPDVAIVDLYLRPDSLELDGIKLIEQLGGLSSQVAIMLLTQGEDIPGIVLRQGFQAGARGFYRKGHTDGDKIIDVVTTLAKDGIGIEPELVSSLLRDIGVSHITPQEVQVTLAVLAPREREVLALLNHGLAVKEVAKWLKISPNTVKTYLNTAKDKLGGKMNSYQLALFAGLNGWLRDALPLEES